MTGVFETPLMSADGVRIQGAGGAEKPYLAHFGLREEPFPAVASARAYFLTSASYQVLEGIRAALTSGAALLRVCGEDGIGKTLLAQMIPSVMTAEMEPVHLDAAVLGADPFVVVLRRALGMPGSGADPLSEILPFLETARESNVSPVLVVDNAHLLGTEALQSLNRLLAPVLPGGVPLMQVILIGTSHLNSLLGTHAFPHLRSGNRRYMAELVPFTRQEATDYIGYRVRKAQNAARPQTLFDEAAVQRLVSAACGNPRALNVACEAALLVAYADGAERVLKAHADRAVEGVKMPSRLPGLLTGPRLSWVAGLVGVLIGAGVTAALISRDPFGAVPLPGSEAPVAAVPAASTPAPSPAASAPAVDQKEPAEPVAVVAAAAEAAPEDAVIPPTESPEQGDSAVLDTAEGSAAPVLAEAEIIRGRTVKPHREKPVESAVPEKHPPEKTVSEKTVSDKAAPEKPAGEKRGAEKVVSEKPVAPQKGAEARPPEKPVSEKPVPEKPVSEKPAPVRPAASAAAPPRQPVVEAPPPRPAPPRKMELAPAPASSAGTSAGRQENGRWVWQ
ncbi:ExeA family protein [Novispirillum itersonii]|uniref:ExeA family protein n=1 Tax=Novispirillum itersonii TaxID=189 RepID=UPI000363FAD6|nr:AAA family ATPase [Novispirillum itersonii]